MPGDNILAEKDLWLFIQAVYVDYNEPTKRTWFYPIGIRAHDWRELVGTQMKSLGHDGKYWDSEHRLWQLEKGGETLPDDRYTIVEPIPFPGRAKEKRWYQGHWQKYTRARGWENVY